VVQSGIVFVPLGVGDVLHESTVFHWWAVDHPDVRMSGLPNGDLSIRGDPVGHLSGNGGGTAGRHTGPEHVHPEVLARDDVYFVERQNYPTEYVAAIERMVDRPDEVRLKWNGAALAVTAYAHDKHIDEMLEFLFPDSNGR
jgi:hypothetical protein